MLAKRQIGKILSRQISTSLAARGAAAVPGGGELQSYPIKVNIGKREVVGFGLNGDPSYFDTLIAPFPAIRFQEDKGEIVALREKEKGDWKKMSIDEKKKLYRASFCQTLSELQEPTGEWKKCLGIGFFTISLAIWGVVWLKMFVYDLLGETITNEERVRAQVQRMIDMRVNPVQGLTSNYDYKKNEWKD